MRTIAHATDVVETIWNVEIDYNDDTTQDVTDRVQSIQWGTDINQKDWYCSMRFTNHIDLDSLDPLDTSSSLNKDGSSAFDPLLSRYHPVRCEMKKDTGDSYSLIFQGYAIDVPSCVRDVSMRDEIEFQPFGITQPYKDDMRMSEWTYEDRNLKAMLPSILLDSEFTGDRSHVVIQDDPSFVVNIYTTGELSPWEAMSNAVKDTGFVLLSKYKASGTAFDDGGGTSTSADGFYLTLCDPIRVGTSITSVSTHVRDATFTGAGLDDMISGGTFSGTVNTNYRVQIDGTGTPDTFKWSDDGGATWDVSTVNITAGAMTLNNGVTVMFSTTTGHTLNDYWDFDTWILVQSSRSVDDTINLDFRRKDLRYDVKNIRNWVQVYYLDRLTGQEKNVIVMDSGSRDKYGIPDGGGSRKYRKMRLVEGADSCVDTEGEATDFAYGCLHDTMDPSPDIEIEIPFCWPEPELYDYIRFIGDDYTVDVGVTGISHTVTRDNMVGTTTIRGTVNKVIGMSSDWLAHDLTEEEINKQRREWFSGGMTQLTIKDEWEGWGSSYGGWGVMPWGSGLQIGVDANLHLRSFATEADDGHVVSAVGASWNKCISWAYSHTEIWISIGSETRYGSEPYLTTTRNYAMISPVPPGKTVYVKIRHIPWDFISTMGKS